MALRNPPSWLQGGEHPAENDRLVIDGLLVTTGVAENGHFAVSPGGGMSVSVAAGSAYVPGTVRSNQGVYHVINDNAEVLAITTAPTDNPRIDAVVVTVKDADVSGSENVAVLSVITGTPASSPSVPARPSNSLLLGTVLVGVSVGTISSGNITDRRGSRATARGGIIPCTSTTRPSSPDPGQMIYESNTGFVRIWHSSAWNVVADLGQIPTVFNPPRVRAYQSSPTSTTSGDFVAIPMQATEYDTHSMHSNTTNPSRLVAPISGLYHVIGQVYMPTADTGKRRVCIAKNGTVESYQGQENDTDAETLIQVVHDVTLTAGQYVELYVYQNAGNVLNTSSGPRYTYISARWVAPLP